MVFGPREPVGSQAPFPEVRGEGLVFFRSALGPWGGPARLTGPQVQNRVGKVRATSQSWLLEASRPPELPRRPDRAWHQVASGLGTSRVHLCPSELKNQMPPGPLWAAGPVFPEGCHCAGAPFTRTSSGPREPLLPSCHPGVPPKGPRGAGGAEEAALWSCPARWGREGAGPGVELAGRRPDQRPFCCCPEASGFLCPAWPLLSRGLGKCVRAPKAECGEPPPAPPPAKPLAFVASHQGELETG